MTSRKFASEGPGRQGVAHHHRACADRTTSFHVVNYVITLCQENGYRKFLLNAMKEEKKDTK